MQLYCETHAFCQPHNLLLFPSCNFSLMWSWRDNAICAWMKKANIVLPIETCWHMKVIWVMEPLSKPFTEASITSPHNMGWFLWSSAHLDLWVYLSFRFVFLSLLIGRFICPLVFARVASKQVDCKYNDHNCHWNQTEDEMKVFNDNHFPRWELSST